MKSCREVTRLLSEAQERPLTLGERTSLRIHLMICAACRNFGQQMHSLRQISRTYARGNYARGNYVQDKQARGGHGSDDWPENKGDDKPGGKGGCC